VERYLDAKHLAELYSTLTCLPAIHIDHLGLSRQDFSFLIKLVERGSQVKASGGVDLDVRNPLREIYSANSNTLMFGTDLPCTRAPRPYSGEDLLLVLDTLGEAAAREGLHENAVAFYRPAQVTR
jgi:hypothetical protein